ncbi:hypothetical protein DVH05_022183 [Phytophthora capsici]|nr:hypothetical protein DVH05_022183 [Phytophthora capsici]
MPASTTCEDFAQYIDINVKLADNTVSPLRYWKLSDVDIEPPARANPSSASTSPFGSASRWKTNAASKTKTSRR